MITEALHKLANHRQALSREEARAVMAEILTGQTTDAQAGGQPCRSSPQDRAQA